MTIPHLNQEQIQTWTLEQKDRWWLENVYRGNMPQLTLRSAATGFILGSVLSATNLYVGAKTGWSLGVGVTSVILAFAIYRTLQKIGIGSEFSILENNCSQSIATAAGYMTAPLTSSMAAYMIVDNRLLPWHQLVVWNVLVSILGVLFAFPMKRRFINDEQHPFPEGRAAGVVMDTLHHADASVGMASAAAMLWAGAVAALTKFLQAESIQEFLQSHIFRRAADQVIRLPERVDHLFGVHLGSRKISGVTLDNLTIVPSLELALVGAGGLMGIRGAASLMIGAVLNYFVLAPIMIERGEITAKILASGEAIYGLRQISLWSLWPGVALMVAASFVAFFAKPAALIEPFVALFSKRKAGSDVLRDIEVPIWISIVGIPIVSLIAAITAHYYFGVNVLMCLIGLPLTFVLTLVAANSTALTSITPVGATSKITQLFYGAVQPGNIRTNLATASLTAEVVSNASNLLMDIKPGYMLGAKPRQQAIGHIIGIIAGSVCSVPLFFLLFTQQVQRLPDGGVENIASIQSEQFPMPSVTVWKAVAEVLMNGIDSLPTSVQYAVLCAALIGIVMELARIFTKGRFPLSAVAMGLAFVIDFGSCFAMFLGAFIFWLLGVERPTKEGEAPGFWKSRHEPICAGIIAGAALMGILDAMAATGLLANAWDRLSGG